MAVSLIAVVAFPAGLMLINNAKLFENGRERIALQGNTHSAMKGVFELLLDASGVYPVEVGAASSDGYVEARQLRVIKSGGREDTITVRNGVMELNGNFQASQVLLEIQPVDGTLDNCRGLNIRITSLRQGLDDYRLVSRIYFRNGE